MNYRARFALLLAATVLSACEDGRIGVELSADPAAATTNREIDVTIEAITLRRDDNSEDRIDFEDPAPVNLMHYDNLTFPLLDAEALDAGHYTGIRLEYRNPDSDSSDDNYVIDANGTRHAMTVNASNTFTPLDLKVKKKGKSYTLQVRLDLRLSYSESDSARTLTPVIRAARDTKAARVSGSIKDSLINNSSCRDGRTTGAGVAIYAFNKLTDGQDPHDYDGSEPLAIASTPVVSNGSGNWRYNIGVLPPGEYTLALTCNGGDEDPRISQTDDIDFLSDTHDVGLDEGDEQDEDFN